MKTRILGRTGLEVGVLGMGTEYLVGQEEEAYIRCFQTAADRGVNYIDVLFSYPEYRDRIGKAIAGRQDQYTITGHIGCAESDGQYRRTRNVPECATLFDDLLQRLDIEKVQIVMVQFVDTEDDYDRVMGSEGLYDLAKELKRAGKADHIGISIHDYTSAERAALSGAFDVIMFPIGVILAPVPREGFFDACAKNNVGVVAMKPYGGGRLFRIADGIGIDPCRLVGYPLLNAAVSTVITGVKNDEELLGAISGMEAIPSPEELRRYAGQIHKAGKGDCVYCNHCLPCPAHINIGELMMALDEARKNGVEGWQKEAYEDLKAKGSDCTECGVCETRCPFEVPVMERMKEAVSLFGC